MKTNCMEEIPEFRVTYFDNVVEINRSPDMKQEYKVIDSNGISWQVGTRYNEEDAIRAAKSMGIDAVEACPFDEAENY